MSPDAWRSLWYSLLAGLGAYALVAALITYWLGWPW